jgi:hypothetical protein
MSLLTLLTLPRISTVRACARDVDNQTMCQKCHLVGLTLGTTRRLRQRIRD